MAPATSPRSGGWQSFPPCQPHTNHRHPMVRGRTRTAPGPLFTAESMGQTTPRGSLFTVAFFFRLPPASSPEAYSSSSSASSYSRSNFFPSGLRLEMTVICFFFLFTFHTQPSRPTMGPETARIFFPGRKTTRETPR